MPGCSWKTILASKNGKEYKRKTINHPITQLLITQLFNYSIIYSINHLLDVNFCSLMKSPSSVTNSRKATA